MIEAIDALFLDRDGIINEVVMRNGIVGSPRTLEELKIREEFANFYHQVKVPMFVVSNQPDIKRNLMSEQDLNLITESFLGRFPKLQFFYCIHDDQDQCICRKPKPGMILKILDVWHFKNPMMIGDSYKDVEAGQQSGVLTVLLRTDYNKYQKCCPDFSINSLSEIFSLTCVL